MEINFHICRKLNLQPYYVKKIFPYDLYRRVKASIFHFDTNIYSVASINHFSNEYNAIQTNYIYNLSPTPTVERPSDRPEELPHSTITNYDSSNLEQGSLGSSGEPIESTTRVRTIDYIPINSEKSYILKVSQSTWNSIAADIEYYKNDYTFLSYKNWTTFSSTLYFAPPENAAYAKIILRHSDSTIEPSYINSYSLTEFTEGSSEYYQQINETLYTGNNLYTLSKTEEIDPNP